MNFVNERLTIHSAYRLGALNLQFIFGIKVKSSTLLDNSKRTNNDQQPTNNELNSDYY